MDTDHVSLSVKKLMYTSFFSSHYNSFFNILILFALDIYNYIRTARSFVVPIFKAQMGIYNLNEFQRPEEKKEPWKEGEV